MEGKMPLKKIADFVFEIPKSFKSGMKVPARIIASEKILNLMEDDVVEQITNVATLPGIHEFALALPDAHVGYGFPIGGVAAFDLEEGVISPGGIGFDINCGVRLLRTNLTLEEIQPKLRKLVDILFASVPAGVGSRGFLKLDKKEFKNAIEKGARWCIENGFGFEDDLSNTEEGGQLKETDFSALSSRAIERGLSQLGTLGSGNHYLEIQRVSQIFDKERAASFGIVEQDQIVIMFHCGSRGFGHQIGMDYLNLFNRNLEKYKISVNDHHLACAPFRSIDGQNYFYAANAGANLAFANRQLITFRIRQVFEKIFGKAEKGRVDIVYDVCHNIAKVEEYKIKTQNSCLAGRRAKLKTQKLLVHRKGATRSLPGLPVIVGGSMEEGGYLMLGQKEAIEKSFGSTCHGSGRLMSRSAARKRASGRRINEEMEKKGVYVRAGSYASLIEEAGFAYKKLDWVVETVTKTGLSRPVARFLPIGNIKG